MHLRELADPRTPFDLYVGQASLPREALGPRSLDRHVLFLLRRGQYAGEIGGRAVTVRTGDLLWLPAGVPHRLVADGPLEKWFIRLLTPARLAPDRPVTRPGPEAEAWCAALHGEYWDDAPEREVRLRALLVLLLSAWNRAVAHRPGALPPERRARLLQAVQRNPAHRWTRTELAKLAGVSPLHLARQARASFGVPLRRWLVETRIRAAARDLRESDAPVGEVAARYGYADGVLFSRQFRAIMGRPPREWRTG